MSDSDCSNCSDRLCPYREYSYNCYRQTIKIVQEHMNNTDLELFKSTLVQADALYEKTYEDVFQQLKRSLQEVIDLYNGE